MVTSWMRLMVCVALLLACPSADISGQAKPVDVFDATSWDLTGRIPLNGKWTVVEEKLVSPDAIPSFYAKSTVRFPLLWNELRLDGTGKGCATYALNVVIPKTDSPLALEIPQLYSSYKVWVNGHDVGAAGIVGTSRDSVVPQWIYETYSFEPRDTLQLVLQISNYHHDKGGAAQTFHLGLQRTVHTHFAWSMGSSLMQASFLLLEGIIFLLFYRRSRKRVILYFALLCLTWSVRTVFSNVYPITFFLPEFSWVWMVKIEYITLYLAVIWAALFLHELFSDMSNPVMIYLPVVINGCFLIFTMASSPEMFTRWISLYLGIAALVILYGVTLAVRALMSERRGSWYLMSSICVGILLFGYDIAAYQVSLPYNTVFMNLGYVAIFLLTTVSLLYHLGILKGKDEKDRWTLEDLFPGNKSQNKF